VIPRVDASTRLIALLGDPVGHSLSPVIQNAAFREAGVPGVYLALRTGTDEVAQIMRGIARAGGGGNITVPHKEFAIGVLDRVMDAVHRTGACNTFWGSDEEIWGDNTDVVGFSAATATLLGRRPDGARVLLIGAGGAARAAIAALEDDGADEVVILNRSRPRAEALTAFFAAGPLRLRVADSADSLAGERFDLVVNATSLGLRRSDPPPLPPDLLEIGAALDMVYDLAGTAWTRSLRDRDVPTADGLEMLIHQAAAAFTRWWDRPAPVAAMRAAILPTD
jgi:shikimate dehydrogenase